MCSQVQSTCEKPTYRWLLKTDKIHTVVIILAEWIENTARLDDARSNKGFGYYCLTSILKFSGTGSNPTANSLFETQEFLCKVHLNLSVSACRDSCSFREIGECEGKSVSGKNIWVLDSDTNASDRIYDWSCMVLLNLRLAKVVMHFC